MKIKAKKPKYQLRDNGEFVIENYNFSKPFANFFPGIAGKYGIPMWVFYVNRGQAIASFGTRNKSHSILEFVPANKAWEQVSLQGYRTFIKLKQANKSILYEPFHNGFINLNFNLLNRMLITSYGLNIEEENLSLGLSIKVEYFTIPNDNYAGLARIVTIKNTGRLPKKIELLDGLPKIIPFGTSNLFIKNLSRTIEAWMNVENLALGIPFYKLAVEPKDTPEVIHIEQGNFYLGFSYENNKPKIIKPIVDPDCIFKPVTDFSYPHQFQGVDNFLYPKEQLKNSKTPCGFILHNLKLAPKQENTFYSVAGYMRNLELLNSSYKRIIAFGYLAGKKEENKRIIEQIQDDIFTSSGCKVFDLYARQTYLDNILRGGYPLVFDSGKFKSVFYLYSRKHGDLERDYNKFLLEPTYFAQGNGNYRDANQNRRCDVWFNPQIQEENLVYFLNLLQTDGFNPLVIKGTKFIFEPDALADLKTLLNDLIDNNKLSELISFLNKPFSPGELVFFIEKNDIRLKSSIDKLLNDLLSRATKLQDAEHKEGYWSDHWTYNLDLLENYFNIYPEKLKELIFENRIFTFYDNSEKVRPRGEKYLLYNGSPRQLHSVTVDYKKLELISKRAAQPNIVRTQYGKGDIYKTTLINKLFCILVNKMTSLDPFGIGIEMEANKPNWFDALNGLPALFGSSVCETFELKRLILFIKTALEKAGILRLQFSKEIFDMLSDINKLIQENLNSKSPDRDYKYWDKSYTLKEDYRQKTLLGLSGNEIGIDSGDLSSILNNFLRKLDLGINKAYDKTKNIYYTYFINEVSDYELTNPPHIRPKKFTQRKLPYFLESQMHALRLSNNPNYTKKLYRAVKKSSLYDKKLRMYKVTASLLNMPEEIGRCRVFSPGWLENESIWMHMEYKYLLEILKKELYKEFYEEFKNLLIPFQPPQRYGRSILENSSFIVSSAFADFSLHGNGFVARLSGSTAEFINLWLIMNIGTGQFFLNELNELSFRFKPVLAGWLFDRRGKYSFNFLGRIRVTYHNSKRRNTFGRNAVIIKKISFNDKEGKFIQVQSDTIPHPYAQQIRSRQITEIDVYFGTKD